MQKKLIGLFVPAVQGRFDLLVPMDVAIQTLIPLLADGIAELCKKNFVPSRMEALILQKPEMLLDPQKTLTDYGIEDGAQLILI